MSIILVKINTMNLHYNLDLDCNTSVNLNSKQTISFENPKENHCFDT